MVHSGGRLIADRFLLQERIGSGGMGTVWRADDTLLRRIVAVKQLRLPDAVDDPATELPQRALREAQAAARLNHPGAVTVYDAVRHDGEIFVVMEYVEATTLQSIIDRDGALDVARVARIGGQVATVLTYAHERGVIHRDVKPANLMVFVDDRVKVADFGITRIAGEPAITRQGIVLGSPAYMAPEQLTNPDDDAAGDWWSLGATLYHAVEGRPPFPGASVSAVIAAVLTREADPPRRAGPVLGPLLLRLLAKDPRDRPAGDELTDALAAVVPFGTTTGMRIVADPPTEVDSPRSSTAWRAVEPTPIPAEPAPEPPRPAPPSEPKPVSEPPSMPVSTAVSTPSSGELFARPLFSAGLVALGVVVLTALLSPSWTEPVRTDLDQYSGLVLAPSFEGLRAVLVTGGLAALGAAAVGLLVGRLAATGPSWWNGVLDWGGQIGRSVPVLLLGCLLAAFPGRATVPAVLAVLASWPLVATGVRAARGQRLPLPAIIPGAALAAWTAIVLQATLDALTLGPGDILDGTASLGLVLSAGFRTSFRYGLLPLGLLLCTIGALVAVMFGTQPRAGIDDWLALGSDRSRGRLLAEFVVVAGSLIMLVAIFGRGVPAVGWRLHTVDYWPYRLELSALIAALALIVRWALRRLPRRFLVVSGFCLPAVVLGGPLVALHWLGPAAPTDSVGWFPHLLVAAVAVGFLAAGTDTAVATTTMVISGLVVIESALAIPGLGLATVSAAFDGVAWFVAVLVISAIAICYGAAATRR